MNRKTVTLLCLAMLCFLAGSAASCGRTGLGFDDYSSEEQWRTALLQQVPVDSSVGNVIEFLEREGFSERSDWSSCDSYHQNLEGYVTLMICEGGWFHSDSYWLIRFQFDGNGKLKDISVDLGPT